MDIEEIKKNWSQINDELEKQKKINTEIFTQITKDKAKNSLRKILNYEIAGGIVLVMFIVFIALRFNMLDTSVSFASGIVAIVISLFSLILSGILMNKIMKVKFYEKPLVETIKNVSNLKLYYYKYKIAVWINAVILAFSFIPVFIKIVHQKNIFEHFSYYIIPISIGLTIGIVIAYFIFKRLYEFNLSKVENLLKDLEE